MVWFIEFCYKYYHKGVELNDPFQLWIVCDEISVDLMKGVREVKQ